MNFKIIAALIGISLFLGILIYIIRVIILAYKIIEKEKYKPKSTKYFRDLLLTLQDESLKLRDNVNQNTAVIEFDGTKDIILYLYNKKPGVDKDGEVFAYIGIMPFDRPITYKDLNPIYIYDTATGTEYHQGNKSTFKRIVKIQNVLSSEDPNVNVNVTWSVETLKAQETKRDFILDNLERGNLP